MQGNICKAAGKNGEQLSVVNIHGRFYSLKDGSQPDLCGWSINPTEINIANYSDSEFSLLTQAWSDSARASAAAARRGSKAGVGKTADGSKQVPSQGKGPGGGGSGHDYKGLMKDASVAMSSGDKGALKKAQGALRKAERADLSSGVKKAGIKNFKITDRQESGTSLRIGSSNKTGQSALVHREYQWKEGTSHWRAVHSNNKESKNFKDVQSAIKYAHDSIPAQYR